jgi:hypothetical protein
MTNRQIHLIALVLVAIWTSAPAFAQQATIGQTARSSVGQAGQRQTRDRPVAGIQTVTRVDARVQNRVQSRIRTRIDRVAGAQTDSTLSFRTASEQARIAGRRRR